MHTVKCNNKRTVMYIWIPKKQYDQTKVIVRLSFFILELPQRYSFLFSRDNVHYDIFSAMVKRDIADESNTGMIVALPNRRHLYIMYIKGQ